MIHYFLSGAAFGLANGLSPGPLLMLVISQSLRYGKREGMKVALAPLITDFFMIAVIALVLSQVPKTNAFLAILSILGAGLIAFFGIGCLRSRPLTMNTRAEKAHSVLKGVVINLLNPFPYLFWTLIGTPILLEALSINVAMAVIFIGMFYVCFVGSNMLLAIGIGHTRQFLQGRAYLMLMRVLGLLLLYFAYTRFMAGIEMLSTTPTL